VRRKEREQLEREAAALSAAHAELRSRLLSAVERTDQLGDDLLAEVALWTEERKDAPS
jgi:hypothetical protein